MVTLKNNTVALVGMMGCGKTSVGRMLAKKLGAQFLDLDEEIAARHGELRQVFAKLGEEEFRILEFSVLKEITDSIKGELTVLSLGGGTPTYEPSRRLICERATVVWLRRSAESVVANARVLSRPPICGDADKYRRTLTERYPIYKAMAEFAFYNAFPQRTAREIIKKIFLQK